MASGNNLRGCPRESAKAPRPANRYPQLTIRVSGYAVNFVRLTREQQEDVISRTFHGQLQGGACDA
jgi:autonomous glycyl radical cofactor GrcA